MGKRKERSPEEQERRGKIRELLELSGASSMTDIQELFKETIAEFMEDGLEAELSEALGYIKYDYKQKETENSRNGHSSKKLRTSYGEVDVSIPRDRKGEFEPQLLKKNQTSISPDIEEKILSMYAKGMSTRDIEAHSTYFKYPQEIRRLIYTTNTIEGFNRQLRKVSKAKSVFPTDDSLLKMLYLAMMEITGKWTGRRQDWNIIHAQLAVYFAERMPD